MDRFFEQLISDTKHARTEYDDKGTPDMTHSQSNSGIEEAGWKRRHTRHWSNGDLLDFIYALAREFGDLVSINDLAGERFQNLSGGDLYRMTHADFVRRDPVYGAFIYQRLQLRMSQDNSTPELIANCELSSNMASWSTESHLNFTPLLNGADSLKPCVSCDDCPPPRKHVLPLVVELYSAESDEDLTNSFENTTGRAAKIAELIDDKSTWCPQSSAEHAGSTKRDLRLLQPAYQQDWLPQQFNGGITDASESIDHKPPLTTVFGLSHSAPVIRTESLRLTQDNVPSKLDQHKSFNTRTSCLPKALNEKKMAPGCPVKRTYTRRLTATKRTMTTSDVASDGRENIMKLSESRRETQSAGKGSLHLWEFIRDLLRATNDDTCNISQHLASSHQLRAEQIIQWEDQAAGVFRILDSRTIAILWGEQKHHRKKQMTYEKLSRALRWCRTYGFLSSVPKDGRYPKKLCFRFGQKATNWQN